MSTWRMVVANMPLLCRRISSAPDAKQTGARSLQALGIRAADECDAARTGSKVWWAKLRLNTAVLFSPPRRLRKPTTMCCMQWACCSATHGFAVQQVIRTR